MSVYDFSLIQKIPELQKEIELLQTQKLDVEKQAHSQKRELRGKPHTRQCREFLTAVEPGQLKLISSMSAMPTPVLFPIPWWFNSIHPYIYSIQSGHWPLRSGAPLWGNSEFRHFSFVFRNKCELFKLHLKFILHLEFKKWPKNV